MTHVRDFVVPPSLQAHAEAWLDGRERMTEAAPKLAASVLLLREKHDRPTVFMLRRVPSMAFAASMWVFPGGGIDPRDAEADVPWAGPSPAQWAEAMGLPQDVAQAVVIAAVREVFEECGVLLAGPSVDAIVADVTGADWRVDRAALVDHTLAFGELLRRRQLVLRSDLLALQDHWTTPRMEPKRYDTWFFVARLPDGQQADDDTTEADLSEWVDPAALLRDAADGSARVLPPTIVQLENLAAAGSFAGALAGRPTVIPVMPEPHRTADGIVLRTILAD